MNPFLLAAGAIAAAFLSGCGIGFLALCREERRPRAAGPFDVAAYDDWQPETACDITGRPLSLDAFECPRWSESRGACCPPGAVRPDCPYLRRLR